MILRAVYRAIAALALVGGVEPAAAVTIPLDPRATYLQATGDPSALGAVPIALAPLSLTPGDTVLLESLGDFGPFVGPGDVRRRMIGVFSSSPILLGPDEPNRVQGAIDAGSNFVTQIGDIPQDFRISNDASIFSALIQVPIGASHLFITADDAFYGDNFDTDGDFAARVTEIDPVPEPATLLLLGTTAAGVGLARWRQRRHQRQPEG